MVLEHDLPRTMVTLRDVASQMEGMEIRMQMLHTGFRQELDGLQSSIQQLNPKEIKEGITRISHLERSIGILDKGIQEIKKMLLMGGKNTASSSTLEGDFSLHEPGSPDPMGDRGKAPHVAPQPTTRVENLPTQLELPVFEEIRMQMLHTGFRQELDGLQSSIQQLNPKEIKEGITRISHLERSIGILDKGIQEIKKMLLMGGKNTASSSTLEGDFSLHEPGSPDPMGDRGKAPHVAPQPTTTRVENLPRQLELPVFEGSNPASWIFRAKRYFEFNSLQANERLKAALVCMEGEGLAWYNMGKGATPFSWMRRI